MNGAYIEKKTSSYPRVAQTGNTKYRLSICMCLEINLVLYKQLAILIEVAI